MPSDVSSSLETSLTLILEDFLYISSSLQTPLALILEDDVLDLRLVLEDALTRVLCLLHLILNNFASLDVCLDQFLDLAQLLAHFTVGRLLQSSTSLLQPLAQLALHINDVLHASRQVVDLPTIDLLQHILLVGEFVHCGTPLILAAYISVS